MTQVNDKVSKIVDGKKYEVTLLTTSRAFITGQKLLKLSLPSMGAAVDGMFFADEFADNQTWAAVAIHMLRQMDDLDLIEIVKELLEHLTVDGQPVDFETYFRGNLGSLVTSLELALMENYSSLFIGSSLIEKLMTFIRDYQTQASGKVETPEAEKELLK